LTLEHTVKPEIRKRLSLTTTDSVSKFIS